MHLVWKRPDGYLDAHPNNYRVISVANSVRLWLHVKDKKNFPFRVSGGWQDEHLTARINGFVNELGGDNTAWLAALQRDFDQNEYSSPDTYLDRLLGWIGELARVCKGDEWERLVLETTLHHVEGRIGSLRSEFAGR